MKRLRVEVVLNRKAEKTVLTVKRKHVLTVGIVPGITIGVTRLIGGINKEPIIRHLKDIVPMLTRIHIIVSK